MSLPRRHFHALAVALIAGASLLPCAAAFADSAASALKEGCVVTAEIPFSIVGIRQLRKCYGADEVVEVGDRVVFMHAGRIHEIGPPAQSFGSPRTPELQQFLATLH